MTPPPFRVGCRSSGAGVLLDARTVRPGMTGVGRTTLELARGLAALGIVPVRAVVLAGCRDALAADPSLAGIEWLPTRFDYESHPTGDLALRFALPRLAREGEVWHGPAFAIPGGRRRFPRVATIHDLGVFKRPADVSPRFGWFMRRTIAAAIRDADLVVTPTEAVRRDATERFPEAAAKIRVVFESPPGSGIRAWEPSEATRSPDAAEILAGGPYVLSVGPIESRKDPATAARALALLGERPDLRWIWIGGEGRRAAELNAEIDATPAAGRFLRIGRRPDDEVRRLMRGALALVYPSLEEGFGLPPLEAMRAGIPAVVSDLPVLREVCGDAAFYFAPGDAEALARRLREAIGESPERTARVEAGKKRLDLFDRARTAEAMARVYEEARGRTKSRE